MSNSTPSVSIIVPTLNEEKNLPILFKRIKKVMAKLDVPYEIIVIDDNSTDKSFEISQSFSLYAPLRIGLKKGEQGKSFSILEGIEHSYGEIICTIDADLQYPPEEIAAMYHTLQAEEADVILTDRASTDISKLRLLMSRSFNVICVRGLFGIDYDTQSGLKMFRRQLVEDIDLEPSAWSLDLELVVKALETDHKVLSRKISLSKRVYGKAKVKVFKTSLELFSQSFAVRRKCSIKKVRAGYKRSKQSDNFVDFLYPDDVVTTNHLYNQHF